MMSDPGYPEDIRNFDNVPGSPFYEDIAETEVFEDKQEDMMRERIQDVEGSFLESFTEADTSRLKELSEAVLLPADEKSSIRIGDIVRDLVEGYCMPKDEDVLEQLNQEPDE